MGEEALMRLLHPLALVLFVLVPALAVVIHVQNRRIEARRAIPLVLRALAVGALVLVVAGLQHTTSTTGVDVVYLVDVSDSVGPDGATHAERFVERSLTYAGSDDRAAIVLVADGVAVERGLQSGLASLTRDSVIGTGTTRLADGVLRSLALFEAGRPGRIVLLSDGQETSGDVAEAARLARDAGVEVSTVPLAARPPAGDVFVRRIDAPVRVRIGEVHEFRVVVAAAEQKNATVTVYQNDRYYGEDRVQLGTGDNVIAFEGSFEERGIHRYRVVVSAPDIPFGMNNEAEALVRVTGEPEILYVADNPAEPLLSVLNLQGFSVAVRPTDAIPGDIGELIPYDAIIFDNVPAYDMSVSRMEAIERYVRDTGGGFLMIGGDNSFGAGGYYRTPIERLLPVDMDVSSTMRMPSLTMVFVVDKSGSMGAVEVSGVSRLDLVKEAVVSAVEIMNPFYNVGLIAFDAGYEWIVPVTHAGDRDRIVADLGPLAPGGGTVLGGALREALRTLRDEDAAVKHIVVLSDGLTSDSGFDAIIDEYADASITISTVSVGSSADRRQMQQLAELGGGRSYHAADSRSVPRIFTTETTIMSRNLIVERPFIPQIVSRSPVVEGIHADDIPPLEGFVLTYQKPDAQMVLAGSGGNPVLSTRQYGLGRTVAFTSDFRAKWGRNWLDWRGYSQLVAQSVRWIQRSPGDPGLTVGFEHGHDTTDLVVDALTPEGAFRNLLELSARVQPPVGEPYDLHLDQTLPGRYRAEIPTGREGSYLVTLTGAAGGQPEPYAFTIPSAHEFLQFETDYERLEAAARAGGGLVLSRDDAHRPFAPVQSGTIYRDTLWRLLLIAAIVLLIVELVVKQILYPVGAFHRFRRPGSANARRGGRPTEPRLIRNRREVRHQRETRHRREAGDTRMTHDQRARSRPAPSYAEFRRQVADDYRREDVTNSDPDQ